MLNRILLISLLITFVLLCVVSFIATHYKHINEQQNTEIADLRLDVARHKADAEESKKIIAIYAEANKQAKEFEKELIDDTNKDNLDVVPADYILNQLCAD